MKPFRALENQRTSMLNLHRVGTFRYDLREIMSHYEVSDEVAGSVIASVVVKGSRVSIDSAKEYVRDTQRTGAYSIEVSDEICRLLDRWSRPR